MCVLFSIVNKVATVLFNMCISSARNQHSIIPLKMSRSFRTDAGFFGEFLNVNNVTEHISDRYVGYPLYGVNLTIIEMLSMSAFI